MTLRALVTAAVAFALLLIASTIKSGWLYLVASGLFSLIIAGFLAARRGTARISVERDCPGEVFEGEPFKVTLRITNRGRTAAYLLTILDLQFLESGRRGFLDSLRERQAEARKSIAGGGKPQAGEPHEKRTSRVTVESLGPGETLSAGYELTAPRRGVYGKAKMVVRSGGIFGTVKSERSMDVDSPVTVFPRIYPLESLSLNPGVTTSPVGSFEWSRKGMGQDYYGVREYFRGDSLRHVHWKSSARLGRLIVKEYQQEFHPPSGVVVLLGRPLHGTADENSLEDGLRAAASIIDYFSTTGNAPGLIIPGNETFEFHEGGLAPELFAVLAGYRPPLEKELGTEKLRSMLFFARQSFMPGSAICVVVNTTAVAPVSAFTAMSVLEDSALVLVADESYRKGREEWRLPGLPDGHGRRQAAGFYLLTQGRGISECLSEPLSTTG